MNEKKKKYGFWSVFFTVVGLILVIYGVSVGLYRAFAYIFIAAGVTLIAAVYFRERIKKTGMVTKIVLISLFTVLLADFVICEARIIYASRGRMTDNADYVIILGAKVNGDVPSKEFAERIRLAAGYLKENPHSVAVTTGGKGSDENLAEGEAAKKMLISLGISEDRIIAETESTSTDENFANALELIKADGGSGNSKVMVVSSSFHLFRASRLASRRGFTDVYTMGSTGKLLLVPYYYVREYFAYFKVRFTS